MTNDLLMSKKDLLLCEIRDKHYMKTSDVIRFGSQNFSNRADRDMRALAADGLVRRLSDQQKIMIFGNIREDVWEFVG